MVTAEPDPLVQMIRELKAAAHDAGLADAEIDTELAAYRRSVVALLMIRPQANCMPVNSN
jgi:hypothetical protein